MNIATFLEMGGAIRGIRHKTQWLELPDEGTTNRSVRFGDHAFDLERQGMQIIPVARGQRVESFSLWAKVHSLAGATLRSSSLRRTAAVSCRTVGRLVSRIRARDILPEKISDRLSVCKQQVLSLFG